MERPWIYIFIVASALIYDTNGQSFRQCFTCEEVQCLSPQQGFRVEPCTTATDQCVTIYNEYTPIKRACYGSLNATEKASCDDTTNVECSKCDTDICNYLGRTDFTCVQCSSARNRTCLTAPTIYPATQCLAPMYSGMPSCYIRNDGETTQRGCITTQLELYTCAANTNATEKCSSCSTEGCNMYELTEGHRKCYRGTTLDYCDDANDNCFAYNIYGVKQMCTSEVEDSVRKFCEDNPFRCMECLDDGCNTNVKFNINCRKCDSSTTDTNCVQKPNESTSAVCVDGCATYLKNETGSFATTHRICYENIPTSIKTQCQLGSDVCEPCLEDDCNSKIFPKDRLLCYQCKLAGCNATTLTPTACPLYSAIDKCVSVVKNGQPAEFTCLSSFNRTNSCVNTTSCIASECSESGCNDPAKFEKSTSCVQCNTNSEVKCSTAPATVGSMPCTQSIDTCYTMLQGGNVLRGCLADLNATQQTYCRANCDLCNSTAGCNDQIFPPNRLFCHQCDSRVNSTCGESTTVPSMCLNFNTKNKCVALLTNNGTYIRTCSSDQETTCKDTVVCAVCETYGCNTEIIYGNGTTNTPNTPSTPSTSSMKPDEDGGSQMISVNAIMTVVLAALLLIFYVN